MENYRHVIAVTICRGDIRLAIAIEIDQGHGARAIAGDEALWGLKITRAVPK